MESFQLGNWQVFPKLNQLTLITNNQHVSITPKVMQLLLVLVEHKHEPVSLDNLIALVWRDRVVADSSVYQAIAQLRKVLSADAEHDVYIERISGQGYRIFPAIAITHAAFENTEADIDQDMLAKQDLGNYLLLASLYKANGQVERFQNTYAKLLAFRQQQPEFSIHNELKWQSLTQQKSSQNYQLLSKLWPCSSSGPPSTINGQASAFLTLSN